LNAVVLTRISSVFGSGAQDPARPSLSANEHLAADTVKFLAGALAGLGRREDGEVGCRRGRTA
jgi:hypothetical protein